MRLVLTRHLWGITEPWEVSFPRIRASGYTAIEGPVPAPADQARFRALLAEYGFGFVALVFTSGTTVRAHLDSFRAQVALSQALTPLLINSHSGSDTWDVDAGAAFFDQALALGHTIDTPIAHETHRGRILYNPWMTSRLVQQFEELRLCADYAHWVCVCGRLLESEQEIIDQCAQRCIHIHARVAHEQSAQVSDPRAPEYQHHVETHERWWQQIWDAQATRGQALSTYTPEYGPPSFMQTLPYTQMPVANLWDICDWQAQRAAAQFRARHGDQIEQNSVR